MQQFRYSDKGLALTKSFEGLRLEAYQDCGGRWTIGYGHTGPELCSSMAISEEEADTLLGVDLGECVACVNQAVTVRISQSQYDAMVDFCFNAGRGHFLQSSLLRKVNAGDFVGAVAQFGLWVHAGGKMVPGLVRRRKAEAEIFTNGSQ